MKDFFMRDLFIAQLFTYWQIFPKLVSFNVLTQSFRQGSIQKWDPGRHFATEISIFLTEKFFKGRLLGL
jgi:hypothetical protein